VTAVHHRARSLAGDTIVLASPADDDLADRVQTSLELGARHIVVDLGDGKRIDATTLSSLKRLAGRLRAKGGDLSVVCSQPNLRRILDLTLLSRVVRGLRHARRRAPARSSVTRLGDRTRPAGTEQR
jgi:anti-anti-sigma factor